MAVLATDDFNRSTGIGSNWTMAPSADAAITIAPTNTSATGSGGVKNISYWNAVSFPNDQYAQATVAKLTSGGAPICRVNTSTGAHYEFNIDMPNSGPNSTCTLYYYSGSGWTQLGTATRNIVIGTVVRLECSGSTITGYLDGVSTVTASDSTLAGGQAGLYTYASADTIRWDDFEAGSLAAAAAPRANLTLLGVT